MGQSGSSSKNQTLLGGKSKRKGGTDSLIGDRKIRTIILSTILIAFSAMAIAYLTNNADFWKDKNVVILDNDTCSSCLDASNAFILTYVGCFVMIGSAIFAILLFFINCDDKIGRIAGVGLIIGGLLYLIGWIWFVNTYNNMLKDLGAYDILSDKAKQKIDASLSADIGEALLPSMTAILLGLDIFMHLFDDEAKRLFTNLGNLCIVSILTGPVYYIQTQDLTAEDIIALTLVGQYPINSDGFPWIATGYVILFWFTLLYIVLYICTCCTCDCKDTRCIRLLMALGLIVGGVLSAIGYYIYASDFTSDNADSPSNYTVYYIGYTIAIIGFPVVWALDIGVDDMKG